MQASDIEGLGTLVLWCAFCLSCVFGFIAQRTHFCTMGAVSDIVNMGDWTRMRQWGLAIGLGMLGLALLAFAGQVDLTKTLYASTRWLWLSATVGGLMFGFGMVLASGCGSKTLVRIGSGSLKSVVVFLVMGIASFATLKGVTAVARVATVDRVAWDLPGGASIGALVSGLFGLDFAVANLAAALVVGGALISWAFMDRDFRVATNVLAGVGIGAVVVAMWWVSAHLGYVAEHPDTLEEAFLRTSSGKSEALSFVAPIAHTLDWLMFFSDKSKVLTLGVVAVIGMIAGSCASALVSGSFRWEGFGGTEDVANHLVGATMMGIGGVTAMGCTVGQGLSGISTLSLTSFVAVAAIIVGAVVALRYQVWRLERLG